MKERKWRLTVSVSRRKRTTERLTMLKTKVNEAVVEDHAINGFLCILFSCKRASKRPSENGDEKVDELIREMKRIGTCSVSGFVSKKLFMLIL